MPSFQAAGIQSVGRNAKPPGNLKKRLFSPRGGRLLVRNTLASCLSFALGLLLMWALVELANVDQTIAAGTSFIGASSLHYGLAQIWVFRGSDRGVAAGYIFFLMSAAVGLLLTVSLFEALMEWTDLNYLVARVLVSILAGLAMFFLNAKLNFRSI